MRNLKAPGAVAGHVAPGLQGTASAAFSPNGRLLAWSLAGTAGPRVVVWRLAPAKELLRLPAARVVGFSPDGTQLAAALDYPTGSELLIVDLASGRRRRARTLPWPAGRAETQTPTFNQPRLVDGRHGIAASGALDGTVTLRDTGRGQSIAALRLPGVVERPFLAFDRTGRSLAIATAGGTLTIVDLRIETWRATACRLAARTLTPAEWRLFVGTTRRDAGACAPA